MLEWSSSESHKSYCTGSTRVNAVHRFLARFPRKILAPEPKRAQVVAELMNLRARMDIGFCNYLRHEVRGDAFNIPLRQRMNSAEYAILVLYEKYVQMTESGIAPEQVISMMYAGHAAQFQTAKGSEFPPPPTPLKLAPYIEFYLQEFLLPVACIQVPDLTFDFEAGTDFIGVALDHISKFYRRSHD